MAFGEENSLEKSTAVGSSVVKKFGMSSSSSFSAPCSLDSNPFQVLNYQPEEAQSMINFKGGYDGMQGNESLLSFEHTFQGSGNYSMWEGNPRLVEDFNCFETSSSFTAAKGSHSDWLYTEGTTVSDNIQESALPETIGVKRPHLGESMQGLKKQCSSSSGAAINKKQKPKSGPSKDPQSIAAKNRRERINERLKILQELVPNGSKVDLVTMLEKAISYVKFLQLQVKVLATDEFWPVQGGKAPDISQVKEAIDAILSSQRDSISSSK
ncbi:hypothetical protein SLEP1_g54031 [Rubroshorea leprosula]|uniref:BHLH domain-containing protein n=1 Tax=Rubroshorea leprosula TaxID=152421 RepID=A0AAV5MBK1_9ROSI|nr:hypothetical protein SLEP1_g54031 [Rubroshorea leprosula]